MAEPKGELSSEPKSTDDLKVEDQNAAITVLSPAKFLINRHNSIEDFLKSLPVLEYEVIKFLNNWRRYVPRILVLSSRGIENVRKNGKKQYASSIYSYDKVKKITFKDVETFIIEYENGKHPYIYSSPIGMQIVQEIQSRMAILKSLTKKTKFDCDYAKQFQRRLIKTQTLQTLRASQRINLGQIRSQPLPSQRINNSKDQLSMTTTTTSSSSAPSENRFERRDNKLASYPDNGQSLNLADEQKTTTYNNSAHDNAHSVDDNNKIDVNEYNKNEKKKSADNENVSILNEGNAFSPSDTILNGEEVKTVKESINTRRAKKLLRVLGNKEEERLEGEIFKIIHNPSSKEGKAITHFLNNFSIHEKNTATLVINVQQFFVSIRESILCSYGNELKKFVINSKRLREISSQETERETLSFFIWRALEMAVIPRIYNRIWRAIQTFTKENDEILEKKRSLLIRRGCKQLVNDIPEKYRLNWNDAINELNDIDTYIEPHKKLNCILNCARAIYNTVRLEHGDVILSGDDFIPIFIYVVVNSAVKDLETVSQYLCFLNDPDQLSGEGGYYLTVFSSTLEYLKKIEISDISSNEVRIAY
jgi:hypothetical protein